MAPSDERYHEPKHPISVVSRLTGLSPHVIRVWERRYGAVAPTRTATNRRLYSDADIDRLQMLHTASTGGHSIGHIAALPQEELEELVAVTRQLDPQRPAAAPAEREAPVRDVPAYRQRCEEAVKALDSDTLDATLAEAAATLPQPILVNDLVGPFMAWVGERWHDGTIRIAHEHMTSVIVRQFLANLRASSRPAPSAPVIVVATLPGQHHELGAQMVAAIAASEGWNVMYLGASLPAAEIANAAMTAGAAAAGVSVVYPSDDPYVVRELYGLRRCLPDGVPIIVGGGGAKRYHAVIEDIGATLLADLEAFRTELRRLREARANAQIARAVSEQHEQNAG